MKRVGFFLFLILFSTQAFPGRIQEQHQLEIMNQLQKLMNDPSIEGNPLACDMDIEEMKCPAFQENIYSALHSTTFLSSLSGRSIRETCFPGQDLFKSSPDSVNAQLQKKLGNKFPIHRAVERSCLETTETSAKDQATRKMTIAYLHTIQKHALENQENALTQMAAIDRLLDKETLHGIDCPSLNKPTCEKLQKCADKKSELVDLAGYSMSVVKEQVQLENQLRLLNKTQYFDPQKRLSTSEYEKIKEDIRNKIEVLHSMAPWMKSDAFAKTHSFMKMKLRAGLKDDAFALARNGLVSLLKDTRAQLVKEVSETEQDLNCLKDNRGCENVKLERLNSYVRRNFGDYEVDHNQTRASFEKESESMMLLNTGHCVAGQLSLNEGLKDDAKLVGTTLLGLSVGLGGGLTKIGKLAIDSYNTGKVLHATAAVTILGAESATFVDGVNEAVTDCKKAMNRMESDFKKNKNICESEALQVYRVADLKSCVASMSLSTLPYALERHLGKTEVFTILDITREKWDEKK